MRKFHLFYLVFIAFSAYAMEEVTSEKASQWGQEAQIAYWSHEQDQQGPLSFRIETKRLIFNSPTSEDYPAFHALFQGNTMKYYAERQPRPEEKTKRHFDMLLKRAQDGFPTCGLMVCLNPTYWGKEDIMGYVAAGLSELQKSTEVAAVIQEGYQKNFLLPEAVNMMMSTFFPKVIEKGYECYQGPLENVTATTSPDNIPTARLMVEWKASPLLSLDPVSCRDSFVTKEGTTLYFNGEKKINEKYNVFYSRKEHPFLDEVPYKHVFSKGVGEFEVTQDNRIEGATDEQKNMTTSEYIKKHGTVGLMVKWHLKKPIQDLLKGKF